ncbi:histidine kinase [Longimonas halophila]|uniref:Histidine kinase n=1 Tax=Longimonas halophila TaxID=1469170 RepID=A0A2H3NLV2_9BACT|nr:histidine kinase [Longimonas halophila]PEN05542.1 histidine kinase [Longimonas halophila]
MTSGAPVTGSPSPPRITWPGVGLATVCWLLYTLFYTFFVIRQAPEAPLGGILIGQTLFTILMAAASVPAWWVTVRRMDGMHWGQILAVHAVLGPLYAWGTLSLYLASMEAFFGSAVATDIRSNFQWILFGNLTVYAVQFAIYHLVRSVQRLRWREQQAAEYAALARERELAALKAQVQPHFLFNTLNSISATVPLDPEQAREMIADLAHLLRHALDSTERQRVPLRDEIAMAKSYLDLEARRFSDRLSVAYHIDAPEDALDTPVPPVVLQPLVENAIKHGIAPQARGGTVTLYVKQDTGILRVCVEDTGAGPSSASAVPETIINGNDAAPHTPTEEGAGVGLTNTARRLTHAFGSEAALHTEAVDPHGFRVWFTLPLDTN